jgi:hypothetical protein
MSETEVVKKERGWRLHLDVAKFSFDFMLGGNNNKIEIGRLASINQWLVRR